MKVFRKRCIYVVIALLLLLCLIPPAFAENRRIVYWKSGENSVMHEVKDGEVIVFKGFPYGVEITVEGSATDPTEIEQQNNYNSPEVTSSP